MRIIFLPDRDNWSDLCRRPVSDRNNLTKAVRGIINKVKSEKDNAVHYFSEKFDGVPFCNLKVTTDELVDSSRQIPEELKAAILVAKSNIEAFHAAQVKDEPAIETLKGVRCWRKNVAIEKVGLYIPGGSAPLFSTMLMLGIPAKIAGCRDIIACTPPGKNGKINPLILFTANILGITNIFRAGGAQAIAAMSYGTETIPKVYKIFGPGNQYVTRAKELVQEDGIAIDMPAGPSEVLVIADENADPEFIAADLLSQAEHGPDSQVIMCTDNQALIEKVKYQIEKQIQDLPRKAIADIAMTKSKLMLFPDLISCIEFSNIYAPEHLIINAADAKKLSEKVVNAGSVFIGSFSCESAGDYASGTNHTLPTNGFARSHSGVSVESFIKKISFQELNAEGIMNIGPQIELMAEAESLRGHKNAVSVRLNSL